VCGAAAAREEVVSETPYTRVFSRCQKTKPVIVLNLPVVFDDDDDDDDDDDGRQTTTTKPTTTTTTTRGDSSVPYPA